MKTTTLTTTAIQTATPSTRGYKKTSALQTKRHSVASVTLGQDGFADTNEARYWTQKLGLGVNKYDDKKRTYSHPKTLRIKPVRENVTQQILFGPKLTSKHPPFAIVNGPRVNLYAASTTRFSSFVRALNQNYIAQQRKNKEKAEQETDEGEANKTNTKNIFGDNEGVDQNVDPDRMIQTGGNLALCASFRNDGRLIAVGTDAGEIRVCDVTMRSTLTTFSATNFAIRSMQWFRNGQYIFTGGDDGVARIWNLSSTNKKKPLLTLQGHGDVIRCTALWQQPKQSNGSHQWNQVAVTGSYDHTVRIWNVQNVEQSTEEARCLSVLMHGSPVEAVCLLKSENPDVPMWLLSAGGTTIKVWNPRSGQCISTVSTFHRKTITSLVPVLRTNYEDESLQAKRILMRILTAGLDGVVQFHSWDGRTGSMRHLYSTKLIDGITSVATDNTGDRLAFGTVSGDVFFRMKGPSVVAKKRTAEPLAGTYSFFQRGMNAAPNAGDYTVVSQSKKRRKLSKFDKALKGFRYSEALDEVIGAKHPKAIVGVFEELSKRRGLTHALSGRDEEALEPVVSFVIRNIRKPQYTSTMIGVANKLIDIYKVIAGESNVVDELFRKLKHQVKLECKGQKGLMTLVGQIESNNATI
jgi:U3 small nucleolar RNA-associated protein 15